MHIHNELGICQGNVENDLTATKCTYKSLDMETRLD